MVTFLALYKRPPDPDAFLEHYKTVHVPLAEALPGLQNMWWGLASPLGAGDDIYLVASLQFGDREALDRAMASPEGRAAADDLNHFAKNLYQLKVVDCQ